MAKPKTPSQKSRYVALNQRLNKYLLLVQQIFDDLNLETAKAATSVSYNGSKPFRFSDYPTLTQRVKDLQQRYVDDIGTVIYSGTSAEWKKSNDVQDLLADGVLKAYGAQVNGDRYKIYYQPNNDAMKAFQKRRANGMTLSQKLWNQARNYKKEMEYAISSAIEKGTSAVTLSKRLSKYLHDFPSLQKDYKDKFGKAVECHDCEYRSMRLARSEINMAYRTAEQIRWNQMDFVVGYEIKLSGAHPAEDICDMLKGKYPKDFVWTGWHPNDLCYKVPILKTEEEFWNYGEAKDKPSSNEVNNVPYGFNSWVVRNRIRIHKAEEAGTLPFFLLDNRKYYRKYMSKESAISWRHTHRDEKAIRIAWNNRKWMKEDFSYGNLRKVYVYADVMGVDMSDVSTFLRTTVLSDSTESQYRSVVSEVSRRVVSKMHTYQDKLSELEAIKKELDTPLGNFKLAKLKQEVNEYLSSLPTISIHYGDEVDINRLSRFVQSARNRIDSKIARMMDDNNAKVAKRLGIQKGSPMNHIEADTKRPNINYMGELDEYGVNCQCCVVSYELRRRGYNVTAMPNFKDGKFPETLSHDTAKIWLDNVTLDTPDKTRYYFKNAKNGTELRSLVESKLMDDGRYHIDFCWPPDSDGKIHGHIITIEKDGSSIRWYDPQTNKEPTDNWLGKINLDYPINLLRVDNKRVRFIKIGEVVCEYKGSI